MTRLLSIRGYTIHQAADGLEAIAKYEASLKLHRNALDDDDRGELVPSGSHETALLSSASSEMSSSSKDRDDRYNYYDLILMDFEMPNMNGPKATK